MWSFDDPMTYRMFVLIACLLMMFSLLTSQWHFDRLVITLPTPVMQPALQQQQQQEPDCWSGPVESYWYQETSHTQSGMPPALCHH